MDIGVDPVNPASADAILMSVLKLIEFCPPVQRLKIIEPDFDFLRVGIARPVSLSLIESVVGVVNESPQQ